MSAFDSIDLQILNALQADARLTNSELAERIGLSASQCSRRRTRLEETAGITGYHAHINKEAVGVGMTSMISITLTDHSAENAASFRTLIQELPFVLEAHALTGEMDYQLKVIAPDLKSLSNLINSKLLSHATVRTVKTSIVLNTIKETTIIPLPTDSDKKPVKKSERKVIVA